MKKMLFLPALQLISLGLWAQFSTETYWHPADTAEHQGATDVLFGLQVGVPSREMRPAIHNRMGDVGFGVGLVVLSDPYLWGENKRESALRIGGSLGYTYYGRFKTNVQINGYDGCLKTAYGMLDAKAIVRFRPRLDRAISPFADVQAGGDFYLSSTTEDLNAIESALGIEALDIESTASASFSKGLGGGIALGSRDPKKAKVVVRAMYNWGTRIKYVVRNSMDYHSNDNTLTYQTARAPVRYVLIQVGVGL